MSIISRDLVKDINSGKCLVLIGSGPSNEIGLPSWDSLANHIINSLDPEKDKVDIQKCHYLFKDRKYPEIFSIGEGLLGIEFLRNLIRNSYSSDVVTGKSYSFLANWPFALYLTTNYDDCIYNHLRSIQVHVINKGNTQKDFASLTAYENNIVFKIHGDAENYESIVLTKEQYDAFLTSSARAYWRDKICAVLHMFPVLIIGYSISDPDFKSQLERAKMIALDTRVYLIAADMPHEEASMLNLDFGIKVITYKNIHGDHSELVKLLKRYNPFVAKRKSRNIGKEETSFEEVETASSLYIFTKLVSTKSITTCLLRSYMGLIIDDLNKSFSDCPVTRVELLDSINKRLYTSTIDISAFETAINSLYDSGHIGVTGDSIQLQVSGKDIHNRSYESCQNVERKFKLLCEDSLKKVFPEISAQQIDDVVLRLTSGLLVCFRRRGIEIVKSLRVNTDMDLSTSTDMIEVINNNFSDLPTYEIRSAATDLLIEIILNPEDAVKDYLVMLSHGFFAFHALGLEKNSLLCRKEIAKNTEWIVDSSILIPLLALNCHSHDYALDLLSRMKSCDLILLATENIIEEVVRHAMWMINHFINCEYNSAELLAGMIDSPDQRSNLFIDGYLNWSRGQAAPSVKKYIEFCLPEKYGKRYQDRAKNILLSEYIAKLDISARFDQDDDYYFDRDQKMEQIKKIRKDRGTIRGSDGGDHQCLTEAEIIILCQDQKMFFLTNSNFLDASLRDNEKFTWNPDTMYKYLTTISNDLPETDLLYQSMMQEFYFAGFDVMNKDAVHEYFQEPVKQAYFAIEEVKKEFSAELKNGYLKELIDRFEGVDYFQKPFYARRITEYIVRNGSKKLQAQQQAAEALIKVVALSTKERKLLETLKKKDEKKNSTKRKGKSQPPQSKKKQKRRKKR